MKSIIFGFMLVPLLLFALACDDDDAPGDGSTPTLTPTADTGGSPTDTPGPDVTETPAPVPGLFVVETATGTGTQATPGTRCWGNGCVDYLGPITGTMPVTFTAGNELGLQAEGGSPEEIAHAWIAEPDAIVQDTGDGTLVWSGLDSLNYISGDITVPEEPGQYLLTIFIRYTSGDDVQWGLYVAVE
jgi:hypothetical protein